MKISQVKENFKEIMMHFETFQHLTSSSEPCMDVSNNFLSGWQAYLFYESFCTAINIMTINCFWIQNEIIFWNNHLFVLCFSFQFISNGFVSAKAKSDFFQFCASPEKIFGQGAFLSHFLRTIFSEGLWIKKFRAVHRNFVVCLDCRLLSSKVSAQRTDNIGC